MNLQQLSYIVALATDLHFVKAAERACVTQPTLSMMIKKLEEELSITIFDRTQKPIVPTTDGKEIIFRAKKILAEVKQLKDYANQQRHGTSGEMRLGVIPTLAPYLLPRFLKSFSDKNKTLKIHVRELVTGDIINFLKNGELDIGILATPLHDAELVEYPIFCEVFFVYSSNNEIKTKKKYLLPKDIDISRLWLLEEGHCLRTQVNNLCSLTEKSMHDHLHYESGSLETLKNLVDQQHGITILPHLATLSLTKNQQKRLLEFAPPKPMREISIVVNKNFSRTNLRKALQTEIEQAMQSIIFKPKQGRVISIQ